MTQSATFGTEAMLGNIQKSGIGELQSFLFTVFLKIYSIKKTFFVQSMALNKNPQDPVLRMQTHPLKMV